MATFVLQERNASLHGAAHSSRGAGAAGSAGRREEEDHGISREGQLKQPQALHCSLMFRRRSYSWQVALRPVHTSTEHRTCRFTVTSNSFSLPGQYLLTPRLFMSANYSHSFIHSFRVVQEC